MYEFFFFKQKTAYEMRISDWSSDVCSSDLLELYVLRFEKEKMTLRVPTNKAEGVGMRKLSSDKTLKEALQVLTTKPKVKRTMWSRRAQEYEAKINSGDLVSIAEVTRDLFRADDRSEEHTSELQSLLRSSYAVFCLKKKKISQNSNK